MRKFLLIALIAVAVVACKEPEAEHVHTWGNYIETLAPTITVDGEETRTCATCGATEKRSVAAYSLLFGNWGDHPTGGNPTVYITISSSQFVFLRSKMDPSVNDNTLNITKWEPIDNAQTETTGWTNKIDYPKGYKLTGTGDYTFVVVFLHTDGNSIVISSTQEMPSVNAAQWQRIIQ